MSIIRLTYSGNIYDSAPAGQQDFPLTTSSGQPIPYLSADHIHVYSSADDGATWNELARPTDWDFATTAGTTARLASGIAAGTWIRVQRITPYQDLWTKFQEGSQLTAGQLNIGEEFSMYVDQELYDLSSQGILAVPNQLITEADQKTPDATGLESDGWISDDQHVATTGALSERFDVYFQDTKPADPPVSEYRQRGKLWIDSLLLQVNYWDPSAEAWVNFSGTGPPGSAATIAVGTTTTGAPGTSAAVTNSGTATAAIFDFVIPQGPQGLPGSTGPAGPPGGGLTHVGVAPITVNTAGSTVTYGFDLLPLATLP